MDKRSRAVLLLSGGIDSAVAGAMLKDLYEITAITIEYGQAVAEKVAAIAISDWLGVKKQLCRVPSFTVADVNDATNYYPARNFLFLAHALQRCEQIGAQTIIVGANADDQRDYPDCRPEFFRSFELTARLGSKTNIAILSPLLNYSKAEVVAEAIKRKVPLELTMSCYHPRERTPCGRCAACNLRRSAFEANGLEFNLNPLVVDFGEEKPWLDELR